MDVLDFSDASKIFGALTLEFQIPIAACWGIDSKKITLSKSQWKETRRVHPLVPWLRQLTLLRNRSAHHSRVWNATLAPAGTNVTRHLDGIAALPENQSERVYGCLASLAKVLEATSSKSSWPLKAKTLLQTGLADIPLFTSESIGAIEQWDQTGIWAGL